MQFSCLFNEPQHHQNNKHDANQPHGMPNNNKTFATFSNNSCESTHSPLNFHRRRSHTTPSKVVYDCRFKTFNNILLFSTRSHLASVYSSACIVISMIFNAFSCPCSADFLISSADLTTSFGTPRPSI